MPSKMILDPCCGSRMMWFDKNNPDAIFGDIRDQTITVTDRSNGRQDGTRVLKIHPDIVMDFRNMPFEDATFSLVAFDPPHLETAGDKSWLASKYGRLGCNWRDDIRLGFKECFRVLKNDGVLVFKWNETQVKLKDVLSLVDYDPLFGQVSGRKGMTHWLVFMKPSELK